MEQSKALGKLVEATDLVQMVEDLLNPNLLDQLSAASLSGLRITLKNIRNSVLESHDTLAGNLIKESSSTINANNESITLEKTVEESQASTLETTVEAAAASQPRIKMNRRDLRSTIERS